MKLCAPIAAALLALGTAGCSLHSKPAVVPPPAPAPAAAAVAPPPEPLSAPQTRVKLPPAQPLDPEALALAPPRQAPPQAAVPVSPAVPPARRAPAAASAPPRSDPPAAAAEPARPSIQEVLPEGERNQYRESVAAGWKRIRTWLDSASAKGLSGQAKLTRDRIQSFLKASGDAERRGDMREAAQLAERAEILIRELQGGR